MFLRFHQNRRLDVLINYVLIKKNECNNPFEAVLNDNVYIYQECVQNSEASPGEVEAPWWR